MDSQHDRIPAHASWLLENRRRWPLALLVLLGAWSLLFTAIAGAGREAARARLPRSRAALKALAPPPLEEGKNAAAVWTKVFAALEELEAPQPTLTREEIARYAPVLELAEEACGIERCAWRSDYSSSTLFDKVPPWPLKKIAALCARRAEIAGAENDWPQVEKNVGMILIAARHGEGDPFLIQYLIGASLESLALEAIQRALAAPGAGAPPRETVRRLRTSVRERLSTTPALSGVLEVERKMWREFMDLVGMGHVNPKFITSVSGDEEPLNRQPLPLNGMMAVYPLECASFEKVMGRLIDNVARWERGQAAPPVPDPRQVSSWVPLTMRLAPLSTLTTSGCEVTTRPAVTRLAGVRAALAGLAALEFRLEHGERWPASLEELDLAPEERVDPWDPERGSLRYGVLSDGSAAVWSAGQEGRSLEGEDVAELLSTNALIGFRAPLSGAGARDG